MNVLAVPILAVTVSQWDSDSAKVKAAQQKELAAARGEDASASAADDQMEIVYVVHADTVHKVRVTTGIQDNDFIEILSGIGPRDTVVTAPFNAISKELKNGTKIQITPKDKLFETK